MTTETRSWLTALEIRKAGDGRTVRGLAAPFNAPATIQDWSGSFVETILPGAFSRTIRERGDRVKFRVEHADGAVWPIGRATSLTEESVGLVAELRVSNTTAGNDALELIRDGVLTGLSIGFRVPPGGDSWSPNRSRRDLHEIRLLEVSVVGEPAYSEAKVLAVRSALSPHLTVARQRLELLERGIPR